MNHTDNCVNLNNTIRFYEDEGCDNDEAVRRARIDTFFQLNYGTPLDYCDPTTNPNVYLVMLVETQEERTVQLNDDHTLTFVN